MSLRSEGFARETTACRYQSIGRNFVAFIASSALLVLASPCKISTRSPRGLSDSNCDTARSHSPRSICSSLRRSTRNRSWCRSSGSLMPSKAARSPISSRLSKPDLPETLVVAVPSDVSDIVSAARRSLWTISSGLILSNKCVHRRLRLPHSRRDTANRRRDGIREIARVRHTSLCPLLSVLSTKAILLAINVLLVEKVAQTAIIIVDFKYRF